MPDLMTPPKNSSISFLGLLLLFGLTLLFIFAIFTYILVETRTNLYLDEIRDVQVLCSNKLSDLKFVKVLDYNRYKKYSKVYCGYFRAEDNRLLELNYTSEWKIVLDIQVNKEGALYWPIYF
ncbi:MAG: hypothetical protein HC932_01355 [Thermales bacterium]|nr:hypothetical protein [Thermales bacterium]